MRFWLACTTLALVAAPGVVRADLMENDIAIELRIPRSDDVAASTDDTDYKLPSEVESREYFNQARCLCDDSGLGDQKLLLTYTWANASAAPAGEIVQVLTGKSCDNTDSAVVMAECFQVPNASFNVNDIDTQGSVDRFLPVSEFVSGKAEACNANLTAANNWVGQDTGTNTYDLLSAGDPVDIDLQPPPALAITNATASEGGAVITWDAITTGDVAEIYALCAPDDGAAALPAHEQPTDTAKYDTIYSLCDATTGGNEITDADFGEPTSNELPTGLETLDAAYVCGHVTSTATQIRLTGLEDDVAYRIVMVTADDARNATAVALTGTLSPIPAIDFWEDLNNENPDLAGGLCLVESVYGAGGGGGGGGLVDTLRDFRDQTLARTAVGRWLIARYYDWGAPLAAAARESVAARVALAIAVAPLIVIALAWHVLTLPGLLALGLALFAWRRARRRRRGGARPERARTRTAWRLAAAAGLVALALPSVAAAQINVSPYWDDDLQSEAAAPPVPHWHVGVRVGPYTPSVDDGFLSSPGPYERMYGGGSVLPSLDVHYLFTTPFGQAGFGGSAGIFGKTADAYSVGGATGDPRRPRVSDTPTAFRVVPLEATGIFRATIFDDRWGVPLVPYARGGLGYYVWWIRAPSGDLANVPTCDATGNDCTDDKALGASLGLVGAVGLAIRAERIDASAVRSMRDTGIEHAGFYAEISTAWVNGFGNARKLSLGDTTWSAGIDFEF